MTDPVICLWEWTADKWRLAQVVHGGDRTLSDAQDAWMYVRDGDDNPTEIMGRAVTIWDMESGVRLNNWHPPEWVPWLAPSFTEEVRKARNWFLFVGGGHDLYFQTAEEVAKLIGGKV